MDIVFRPRAAGIIVNEKKELLLVYHVNPVTKEEWLMPPGGGIEPGESAVETVIREVYEECMVECIPDRLIYIREYLDWTNNIHHIAFFFTASIEKYDIQTGADPELNIQHIIETRFYSKEEIEQTHIPVYPEIIKNQFWKDLQNNFIGHRIYLGQQR